MDHIASLAASIYILLQFILETTGISISISTTLAHSSILHYHKKVTCLYCCLVKPILPAHKLCVCYPSLTLKKKTIQSKRLNLSVTWTQMSKLLACRFQIRVQELVPCLQGTRWNHFLSLQQQICTLGCQRLIYHKLRYRKQCRSP